MIEDIIKAILELHPTVQILAIFAFIYLVKGGYITVKWFNNKKKPQYTNDINKHAQCANFPSIILIVKNAIAKMARVQFIEINVTISEQMTEFDDLYVDFKKIFKSNYMTLYRKKTKKPKAGILKEKDVQHYIDILSGMESQLKGITRRFLKKNHFLEKSEEEFRLYIDERSEDYQNEISEILDDRYDSDIFIVSREELYESNINNCRVELRNKVEKFFYKVRTISLEKKAEVKKLEEDIEEFV